MNPHDSGTGGELPTAQQAEVVLPVLSALRITVTEGADEGKSFLVDPASPQRVLIGTSPACDIRLTDPTVSRRHAAIEPFGPRCKVTDLASRNGTWVNNVGVVEAFVRGGETLRCGSTVLHVEQVRSTPGAAPTTATRFGKVVGASAAMRRLYPLCERLASTRIPVLIEGETGTGKEVLAESLHDVGGSSGPFIAFDCSAVAPGLAEAELFGRAAGAPGGECPSPFEQASGGTLFIDEVGDLDTALQPKLLKVLERGEVRRMNGAQPIRVHVRVIAATRRNLDREVAAGRFRDDLFRRIALARIELPPLRERHGDVTLLARHFAESFGAGHDALPADVLAQLEDYDWPGNVRELYSAVARRIALGEVVLGEGKDAPVAARPRGEADVDGEMDQMIKDGVPFPIARRRAIEAFEKRYVEKILEAHNGSVAKASAASGLARRYFQLVKARSRGA